MAEVTEATSSFSSLFYIMIIGVIVIIALIIFFMRNLKYNSKQIWKSIGVSLLITIGIELLLMFISIFLPQPMCQIGIMSSYCPTNAEILLNFSPFTFPAIFLVVLFFYYLIRFIKNR